MDTKTKLIVSLLVLLAVVMIGAAGYRMLGLDSIEAVHMAVVTLSTVGNRSIERAGWADEIWTIVFIAVGFTVAVITFSNLVAIMAGGELRKLFGRRKLQDKIKSLRGHIIICGYGGMGRLICEDLMAHSVPLVVIDLSVDKTTKLEQLGLLYVLGDASEEQTLLEAGIQQAKGLVTVLHNDSDNVYVTLTARSLNDKWEIVAKSEVRSTENKLLRAGADRVVCPHLIGAVRVTNLLLRPAIVELVDVASRGVELEIGEIDIEPNSPLINKKLHESGLREDRGIMVVAIKRRDETTIYNPPAETVLTEGDSLITIGKSSSFDRQKVPTSEPTGGPT